MEGKIVIRFHQGEVDSKSMLAMKGPEDCLRVCYTLARIQLEAINQIVKALHDGQGVDAHVTSAGSFTGAFAEQLSKVLEGLNE